MSETDRVSSLGAELGDERKSLGARFRALFALRTIGGKEAVAAITGAFGDPSALLRHELAFVLGQMGESFAIPKLTSVLKDESEDVMVRHEAGEALGAIGDAVSLPVLESFLQDPNPEVRETCELAVQRIRWAAEGQANAKSPYETVDPTPADVSPNPLDLGNRLVDESAGLWHRYRAMFALRNLGSEEATLQLARGLECGDSALLRHEVAYVLGQVACEAALPALGACLARSAEHTMVRHEAAEAIGSIGGKAAEDLLAQYAQDPSRVVAESVAVALDIAETNTQPFVPCP